MAAYDPYAGVDWTVTPVLGITHAHCETQAQYDELYNAGIRHFAISNYYPSDPVYPLTERFTPGEGSISCPNAEFARMTNITGHCHINGLGSTFSAGNSEDTSPGTTWQVLVNNVMRNLMWPDAGGATLNHTTWSALSDAQVLEILDHDPRMLGIEIYNHSSEVAGGHTGWALEQWDRVLATGRKCFGFCVSDHAAQYSSQWPWYGMNALLCAPTERDCLLAYRNGAFYGRLQNTSLKFTGISLSGSTYTVTTDNADGIKITTKNGSATTFGNTATAAVSEGDVFVRAEAFNNTTGDRIFSNPTMLKLRKNKGGGSDAVPFFFS